MGFGGGSRMGGRTGGGRRMGGGRRTGGRTRVGGRMHMRRNRHRHILHGGYRQRRTFFRQRRGNFRRRYYGHYWGKWVRVCVCGNTYMLLKKVHGTSVCIGGAVVFVSASRWKCDSCNGKCWLFDTETPNSPLLV